MSGIVYLVGAGPGDPGLLTRRGAELLAHADVVVHDGLIGDAVLDLIGPGCERIYAGKKRAPGGEPLDQDAINALLCERARRGQRVVRLKGGDPFVFGRGGEECAALAAAGVRYELVPGVSAATAVPAYAGIPLTARGVSATVAFATGHEAAGKPASDVDWQALARAGTVVLFMALRTIEDCARRLIAAGKPADTPAAAIYWGTTASQRTVTAPLSGLAAAVEDAGLVPPVLVVVGAVAALREQLAWYERRPLFGARVVITRGPAQAAGFARAIADLGGEPLIAPVTRIAPLPVDGPDALGDGVRLADAVARIGDYRWLVFTSGNAVDALFAGLDAAGRDARALANARIACVGRATARALRSHGVRADLVPPHGDGAATAAAIIEAAGADSGDSADHRRDAGDSGDASGALRGARVLFPRALEGRDEAAAALREAGAALDVVPVYRTEHTPPDDPVLAPALRRLRNRQVDVAAVFAPSQARALAAALGDDAAALLSACRVVATIGNTTRRALEALGVPVHLVAGAPDAEVLAREIAACYTRPASATPE